MYIIELFNEYIQKDFQMYIYCNKNILNDSLIPQEVKIQR